MKRLSAALVLLFSFATSTFAAPWYEYTGMFPEDRPPEAAISNYMLVDKPRQVTFALVDRQGNPIDTVRTVELILTSDTRIAFRNDQGLGPIDLVEPGIYEVKVKPVAGAKGEIGFTLRVLDTGAIPATPASNAIQITQSAPPLLQPPAVEPPPAASASPVPAVSVPQPATPPQTAPAMNAHPAPAPHAGAAPVLVLPAAGSYADPFKPVEIRLGREIPSGLALGEAMNVFLLDARGSEQPAPGQYFPSGPEGIRFIPVGLTNGAVYHIRARDPITKAALATFSFATFPEVRMSLTRDTEQNARLEITWPPVPELMPGEDGQVVRLDHTRIVVRSGGIERIGLDVNASLPPFGNINGIEYRGQPWRFSVMIPREAAGDPSQPLEALIQARISGVEAPVDVMKTTLTTSSVTVPTPASGSAPIVATRTTSVSVSTFTEPLPLPIAASAAAPIEHPAAPATPPAPIPEPPAAASTMAPTRPTLAIPALPPIIPVPDPGPTATLVVLKKFAAGEGSQNDAFSWPKGLTWSPDGTLWVVDSQNRRLLRFLDDGQLLTSLGKKGKGPGMLGLPIEITVATAGIFVSDTSAHTVHQYDLQGSFLRDIGTWGTKNGQLDLPHGVCVDGDEVWVTDRGNTKILRFGLDGVYRGGFGKKGELDGYLMEPVGIRIRNDVVWVLEGKSGRIQKFSRDGKPLGSFLTGAKEPLALEIDPWGCPWVADGEGHRVMRFDPSGRTLMSIQPAAGGRQWIPTSVAVRADGIVAIGDGEDRSVHLYRIKKPE
ncbi:MAG TPA: NHL repeat-containing protein [Candidatus Ozemobacteraceae bacterium]|nr:NHL repeat-containing protein [Candidatus Ozemobacteraceae bacterium]